MKSIDFKSLLIGILGTALVLVLSGFSLSTKYQLSFGDQCMVMNTSTGKTKIVQLLQKGVKPHSSVEHAYFGLDVDAKFRVQVDKSLGVISMLSESNSDETNLRSYYSILLEESIHIWQEMV